MIRCDFTLAEYQRYLALAVAEGYRFVSFESLDEPKARVGSEILLRHDIDYAPEFMPPMAALEAELGVLATYCLHIDSRWYSIDTAENRAAIAETLACGHRLGLHFDASSIESDEQALDEIAEQARRLAQAFSHDVRVVSFHMPGRRGVDHLSLPASLINTYGSRFFADIGYVSDSNQNWRGVDLAKILTDRAYDQLQLLIHPFWWRSEPATMLDKLELLADKLGVDVHEIATPEQWTLIEQESRR